MWSGNARFSELQFRACMRWAALVCLLLFAAAQDTKEVVILATGVCQLDPLLLFGDLCASVTKSHA